MTTRRGILKLVGGGLVLAAVGGGAFYALNAPSAEAREPWRAAGSQTAHRERFLSYALLAPNPHNRQPWLVDIVGADEIVFHADTARLLPATDPPDRPPPTSPLGLNPSASALVMPKIVKPILPPWTVGYVSCLAAGTTTPPARNP